MLLREPLTVLALYLNGFFFFGWQCSAWDIVVLLKRVDDAGLLVKVEFVYSLIKVRFKFDMQYTRKHRLLGTKDRLLGYSQALRGFRMPPESVCGITNAMPKWNIAIIMLLTACRS